MVKPSSGWPNGQPSTNVSPSVPEQLKQEKQLKTQRRTFCEKLSASASMSVADRDALSELIRVQLRLDERATERENLMRRDIEELNQKTSQQEARLKDLEEYKREAQTNFKDVDQCLSLVLPRDLLKRLGRWKHALVPINMNKPNGKKALLAVQPLDNGDVDTVLDRLASDGDYEAHGGGSIFSQMKFVEAHPEYVQSLRSFLVSEDDLSVFWLISIELYKCKLFFPVFIQYSINLLLHSVVSRSPKTCR